MGVLREVVDADLPVFYEHQCDPEATAMAAFPCRDRDAFMAHWARTLANESALTWTIDCDGEVAGNIGCWAADGAGSWATGSGESSGPRARDGGPRRGR